MNASSVDGVHNLIASIIASFSLVPGNRIIIKKETQYILYIAVQSVGNKYFISVADVLYIGLFITYRCVLCTGDERDRKAAQRLRVSLSDYLDNEKTFSPLSSAEEVFAKSSRDEKCLQYSSFR